MEEKRTKDQLLDEAIRLYTQGHPQEAIIKLEALSRLYPDDIDLRDTLATIKAEVHDLTHSSSSPSGSISAFPLPDLREHSRKKMRVALGVFILLVVVITGLWGFTRVLSNYQNRGTGAYRMAEEKAKDEKAKVEETLTSDLAITPSEDEKKTENNTNLVDKIKASTLPPGVVPPTTPTTPEVIAEPDTTRTGDITPPPVDSGNLFTPTEPGNNATAPIGEGYLRVSQSPPTMVYVDGVMKGNSQRLGAIRLKEGTHKVTMVSQQYGSRSVVVDIKPNETRSVAFPY